MNGFIGGILLRIIGASVVWSFYKMKGVFLNTEPVKFNDILEPNDDGTDKFYNGTTNLLLGIIVVMLLFTFIYVL